MEHFDPRAITATDWVTLHNLVWFLWLLVFCNVFFGFCMLFGHGVIPSLINTAHIPQSLRSVRIPLYVAGMLFLAVAFFVILNWASTLGITYDLYPKRLI